MRMILLGVFVLLLLVVLVSGIYLVVADPKPAIAHVEKIVPSQSLPH